MKDVIFPKRLQPVYLTEEEYKVRQQEMSKIYLGIDPGNNGGIVWLDEDRFTTGGDIENC